ncbi:response regulator transcription factor [Streptomyces huiliensis]|uniref:response regulator transcription factor n=1 Tax=Streptomyces huiliensis TaxID=2876027 RepID=UPI001CBB3548|nr:response regulator transcription factor [Streptomyces huiliensis]MBZ4318182.1 response regulator transcription factor [Streptomyces huiliensis]
MNDSVAPIRVLVADDQRVTREGLMLLIGLNEGMEVVGGAADGAEAVALAHEHRPDVVLMDLAMPGTDGLAATRTLREQAPGIAVLVLTTYADDSSVFPALRAGAKGYLTKDAGADEIERAIRAVREGRIWMDPVVQERLIAVVTSADSLPSAGPGPSGPPQGPPGAVPRMDQTGGAPRPLQSSSAPQGAEGTPPPPSELLTARETEILTLIAEGLSNTEISERLFLSRATVKTHINRVFAKTGARDRAQAVRYAYRSGLVGGA